MTKILMYANLSFCFQNQNIKRRLKGGCLEPNRIEISTRPSQAEKVGIRPRRRQAIKGNFTTEFPRLKIDDQNYLI